MAKKNVPPREPQWIPTNEQIGLMTFFRLILVGVESAQEVIEEWAMFPPPPDPNDYRL